MSTLTTKFTTPFPPPLTRFISVRVKLELRTLCPKCGDRGDGDVVEGTSFQSEESDVGGGGRDAGGICRANHHVAYLVM